MKHFKIVFGFNSDDYIEIKGDELPKAFYLFSQASGRGMFENGAVRGQDIIRIVEDWHKAMGWNKGYKLTTEDYLEIEKSGIQASYRLALQKGKEIAEFAIQNNRKDLISMPASQAVLEIPETNQLGDSIASRVNLLAEKFKIDD